MPYTIATVDLDEVGASSAALEGPEPGAPGGPVVATFVDHDAWTELRFAPVEETGERDRRTAAIAGVGYTPFSRGVGAQRARPRPARAATRSTTPGSRRATSTASRSFMVMHDSVPAQAVATTLALPGAALLASTSTSAARRRATS